MRLMACCFDSPLSDRLTTLSRLVLSIYLSEKRNITDEKQALNEALIILETQGLGEGKLFLSGTNQLNLGDLTVFGTLRGLEGLPVHTDVVENRGGPIPDWYQRMQTQVVA
jgi:hypothetical protein